jgi:hypothetical protein
MNEMLQSTLTPAEIADSNEKMCSWLESDMPSDNIKAAAASQEYLRVRVREGSINRNVAPQRPVTKDELIPDIVNNTDDPLFIGEIEPDTPGGMVMPVGSRSRGYYFHGRRYFARFGRVMTLRYNKLLTQLLTYKMDLRQYFSDASLKDLLALEDAYWFSAINNMLSPFHSAAGATPAYGDVVPATNNVQWRQLEAPVTRTSVADALSVMVESNLGIFPTTVVVNANFLFQLMKWTHNDVGPQLLYDWTTKGFGEIDLKGFMGVRWLVTIKNWLVGNGTMYIFGPGQFVGPSLVLNDTTMHIKKDDEAISFWAAEQISQVLGHPGAYCRVDLTQVGPTYGYPEISYT